MNSRESFIEVGVILEGEVFPEPIRVVLVQSIGANLKVGGQGLHTRQYHERLLSPTRSTP